MERRLRENGWGGNEAQVAEQDTRSTLVNAFRAGPQADVEDAGATTELFQKWVPELIDCLEQGRAWRFSEIQAHVDGIGSKTLTRKLRRFDQLGLVRRTWFDEAPPHVEYALTPKGRALAGYLVAVRRVLVSSGGTQTDTPIR